MTTLTRPGSHSGSQPPATPGGRREDERGPGGSRSAWGRFTGSWGIALRMARRDVRRHRGRSALIVLMVALPTLLLVFAIEGRLANQHLVEQNTKGPPVDGLPIWLVEKDFRTNVIYCFALFRFRVGVWRRSCLGTPVSGGGSRRHCCGSCSCRYCCSSCGQAFSVRRGHQASRGRVAGNNNNRCC